MSQKPGHTPPEEKEKYIRAVGAFIWVSPQPKQPESYLNIERLVQKVVTYCNTLYGGMPGEENEMGYRKLAVVVQREVWGTRRKLPIGRSELEFASLRFVPTDDLTKMRLRSLKEVEQLLGLKYYHESEQFRQAGHESKPYADSFADEQTVTLMLGQREFLVRCAELLHERTGVLKHRLQECVAKISSLGEPDLTTRESRDYVDFDQKDIYAGFIDALVSERKKLKKLPLAAVLQRLQ